MKMERRRFMELMKYGLGAGALMLAGVAKPCKRGAVLLKTKAMQSLFYPGGLKRLRDAEISKPGKWAG
jgi:hypothetical protein